MFNVGTALGYLDLDTSKFQSGLKSALGDLQTFFSDTSSASTKMSSLGSALSSAGSSMTKKVTLPIVGLGTAAVATAAQFESAMSGVQAISQASGDDLERMKDLAIDLGGSTKYSAQEVAGAMTEMAKAGWDVEQILGGMGGVLDAAAASGESLGTVSTIVADAITGFGLQAEDSARVADILTQAANAGTIGVADLGESFKYIAPVANSMGISIEESVAAISALSTAGIKGSQAGTSLRTMLTRLVKPTKQVATSMEMLGISVADENGNMKSLDTLLSEMRVSFSGLTQEEKSRNAAMLAGQEGMSALLTLMEMEQEEYDAISASMKNASGVAQETATVMQDNLASKIEQLGGSIESLAIRLGSMLIPAITSIVKKLTEVVDWFTNLDESTQKTILTIAGIVAAIGPLLSIGGNLLKSISTIGNSISMINTALAAAGTSIGAVLGPIAAVVAAIAAVIAVLKTLWDNNEEFRARIEEIWGNIKATFENLTQGIVERINSLGFNFSSFAEMAGAIWKGFCDLLAPYFEGVFNYISIVFETAVNVILGIFDFFIAIFKGDWEGAWNAIKDIFISLWNGLVDWFMNIWNVIKDTTNQVLGWFGTNWEEVWTSVKTFFENLWNGIIEFFTKTIPEKFTQLVDWFKELPEKIGYELGRLLGNIANFVVDAYEEAKKILPEVIEKLVTWFKELPGKIWNSLVAIVKKLEEWRQNILKWIKDKLSAIVKKVLDMFKELPGKILGFFKELPSKITQIGTDLIKGLWNGITSAGSWLKDKISGFAGGIIQGFKDTFGIASPSKVMKTQGSFLMQGLALGMQNSVKKVLDSAKTIATQVTDTFSESVSLGSKFAFDGDTGSESDGSPKPRRPVFPGTSGGQGSVTNNYNFYSPVAVTPAVAAKKLKQTSQQLAMES